MKINKIKIKNQSHEPKLELNWKLQVSFDDLVKEMVLADVKLVEQGKLND